MKEEGFSWEVILVTVCSAAADIHTVTADFDTHERKEECMGRGSSGEFHNSLCLVACTCVCVM